MRPTLRTSALCVSAALVAALPGAARESAPLVGLNHLMLVADSATYAAIASSPFLRDTFALVDRTLDGGNERVALFGRSTYVEFRRDERVAASPRSALALGTDQRGALLALAKRLTNEVGPLRLDSLSRRRDSADIPWMYQLAVSQPGDSTLAVRVVEYHPQFVARWFGSAPGRASVARADVVAMHASRVAGARRFALLDVVAVKIAASAELVPTLIAHCRAVGWRVQSASGGTACVSQGMRMFVVPSATSRSSIVAFTMRVSATASVKRTRKTRTFGRSTLRLSTNGLATWEFSEH
jgi:hypothetical protein